MTQRTSAEPFRNKVVERIPFVTMERRREALIEAGHNPSLLQSVDVPIDLLSDSGAAAQSDRQWASLMVGDEAFTGNRSFYQLERTCQEVIGHKFLVPTHLGRGAEHLVALALLPEAGKKTRVLASNTSPTARAHWERRGAVVVDVGVDTAADPTSTEIFRGDVDLAKLEKALSEKGPEIGFLSVSCCPDLIGSLPIRLGNLKEVARIARKHKLHLVLDASRIAVCARFIQEHEPGQGKRSIAEIVLEMALSADTLTVSAREGCLANAGGFVCSNQGPVHEEVRALAAMFEGKHTCGGMAGRDLEAVAIGLKEILNPNLLAWHQQQIARLGNALIAAGLPVLTPFGGAGVFLDACRFAPHLPLDQYPAEAVACALYLGAGVRAAERGQLSRERRYSTSRKTEAALELVGLLVPMRVYACNHLDFAARAIAGVYSKREHIRGLRVRAAPSCLGSCAAAFDPVDADAVMMVLPPDPQAGPIDYEPYRSKTIEWLKVTERAHREKAMAEAGFNTFLLRSEDCTIDLLADYGTSAMSDEQWAAVMVGDESPAGSRDWIAVEEAVHEVLGFTHVLPVHQGQGGEHILSQVLIKPGDTIPGNMVFTTTREHMERAGGTFVDVTIDQAHDPTNQYSWKGDIDLGMLRQLIEKVGAKKIPFVKYETCVNMAGGQPVSMENARELCELCHGHGILVMFDASHCAENAYMIQKKDPKYHNVPVGQILKELMATGDGCFISPGNDGLVNHGAFIATNHRWVHERARELVPLFEGGLASGGMSGRDMGALAQGLYEMTDDAYIRSRVEQTQMLGKMLLEAGVPILEPPGTHAIFLDARRFLPQLDQDLFPAQALAAELYIEGGVRAMERGNVWVGRDRKTGQNKRPKLELVRLAIPRRVYSRQHMEVCAEAVRSLWKRRESIRGLKFVAEALELRFSTARFERV